MVKDTVHCRKEYGKRAFRSSLDWLGEPTGLRRVSTILSCYCRYPRGGVFSDVIGLRVRL